MGETWAGAAPFILSIRYASAGGAALARYVATRPGVEQTPEVSDLTRYVADRPGTTGLFGPDPAAPPALEATQAAIAAAPWHYRMVLSMRGPDAERVGLGEDAQAWRDLARRWVPAVATELGVPQGAMRWVAAMHHKMGKDGVSQPHMHVLEWMDPPTRRARLSKEELRRVRRVTAREVFGPMRGALEAERTARRDAVLLAARVEAARAGARVREVAALLPGRGRAALALVSPEARAKAREAADWLLTRPALAADAAKHDAAARALAGLYGEAGIEVAAIKAREDVRDRIAQVVLRAAAASQRAAERRARSAGVTVLREARGVLVGATREAEAEAEWAQRQRARALGVVR